MSIEQEVRAINAKRQRSWEASKAILDRAVVEGRNLTAEERRGYQRASDEITKYDRQRQELIASEGGQRELEQINEEFQRVLTPTEYDTARRDEKDAMARFLSDPRGELHIDLRRASYVTNLYRDGARGDEFRTGIFGDTGSSGGSLTMPTLVSQQIFQVMQSMNVMRQTRMTILTTDNGAPLAIPVPSQGAATQVANQNTAFAGTDPTMAAKILKAYDAGELVAIGNDLIEDAGIDTLAWVAKNVAMAVAKLEEQWWVTGTGSGQPSGIMTGGGVGASGTIATGGSLILGPTGAVVEKLIDVQYGVNNFYRSVGEWLVNDSTAATMRKLRSGAGGTLDNFLWSPSPTAGLINGTPDTFLGRPIYASSNVASMASDAKVLAYGDFSRFVAREVVGFRLEKSADLYFDKNQVALRGLTRTDSALTDPTAVVTLHQAVT